MSKRYSKQHKIAFFGDLTLANFLDWCVTLCLAALVMLTLQQLGGTHAETMILSSGLLGVALFFHTLSIITDRPGEPFTLNATGLVFAPYLLYLLLQWLWLSPYSWKAGEELMRFTQGAIVFWLVIQNLRTRNHVWLFLTSVVAMAGIGILIGIMQYFHSPRWLPTLVDPLNGEHVEIAMAPQYEGRASGFFGVPGPFAVFMLFCGMALLVAGFSRRFTVMARLFCLYVGFMALGGVFMSLSLGAMLIVIVGLFLIPVVVRANRRMMFASWGMTLLLLALTIGAMLNFSEGFRERAEAAVRNRGETSRPILWAAAGEQFLQAPVAGNGLGAYQYEFEQYRPSGFNRETVHAHNDYLEILADQGVLGFLLFWGPVGFIFLRALREWSNQPDAVKISGLGNKRDENLRMPTPKFLIGTLGFSLLLFCADLFLEFHLHVPGLLFLFFAILGLLVKCCPAQRLVWQRRASGYLLVLVIGFGVALAVPAWLIPSYTGLSYTQSGRRELARLNTELDTLKRDPGYFESLRENLQLAVAEQPGNAEAWSDLSAAIAAQRYLYPSRNLEFGSEAEACAQRALKLNPRATQSWIDLGIALSMQGRMPEAEAAFRRAVELAPNRADAWHYLADYLNQAPTSRDEALTAVNRALELDPQRQDSLELRRKILVP